MSEPTYTYYEVMGNVDQTEGRGGYKAKAAFTEEAPAVEWCTSPEGHRECGVMGHGPGEVVKVEFRENAPGRISILRTAVWGYRKALDGKFGYGYVDNRDSPIGNPRYHMYLELKAEFEGK